MFCIRCLTWHQSVKLELSVRVLFHLPGRWRREGAMVALPSVYGVQQVSRKGAGEMQIGLGLGRDHF